MYDIKEIVLQNKQHKKKRLVITFHDEAMAIVGEFLMTDVPLMDGEVVRTINNVLKSGCNRETFTGQRCHLQIAKEETVISDLYADVDGMIPLQTYTINTVQLLKLINIWLKRLEQHSE